MATNKSQLENIKSTLVLQNVNSTFCKFNMSTVM